MSSFKTNKGVTEILDFLLDYSDEFAKDDPDDIINTSDWAVIKGTVSIDSSRIEGTSQAIARVSGGSKLHSFHEIENTVVGASGQVYVRTIQIQLTRT